MSREHENYMRIALAEANKGKGRTSPNPCVGAVVVRDDKIVGRGYHQKAGGPHAEVNAIADAGKQTVGSTIYVTLEPCNHTGRTPPCTKAIVDAGLSQVVVGMPDPNPSVKGGGASYLESQGINVTTGVLEEECRSINRPFLKHSMTGLPWVVMKAGMSLDGKIAYLPGKGGRITGQESRKLTHSLRNSLDAILVGVDTVNIDDPSLTTRLPGSKDVKDPVRIILDTNLRLSSDSRICSLQSEAQTVIYCSSDAPLEKKDRLVAAGVRVHATQVNPDGRLNLADVLTHLGQNNITSVLVEGGSKIHGSMLENDLVDEVYLFMAPFFIGNQGIPLLSDLSVISSETHTRLADVECKKLGDDLLVHGLMEHR